MSIPSAEHTLVLCCAQLLHRHDPGLLGVSLCELARRLGLHRETGRRCTPLVERAALDALRERRPGRPSGRVVAAAAQATTLALQITNRILLHLLVELVGPAWHSRLPEHLRARLGAWLRELRQECASGVVLLASWLDLDRKVVARWEQAASKECREPAAVVEVDPEPEPAWEAVRGWYLAFRQLPAHRALSRRKFVPLFNRAFQAPLADLGIGPLSRALASRLERGARIARQRQRTHPRGRFHYPRPFRQMAIDTTYLQLGEHLLYLIVLLDVGSRVVLFQEVFTADQTESVLHVLEQTAGRFGLPKFLLIDRGTPYLNDQVNRWLRERGTRRIVCRRATPTDKACLERYNRTFKEWVLPHAQELGVQLLDAPALLVALRLAARLAWRAYNTEPQHFIDGQSPLERLERHPLAQAAREQVQLELRSIHSAPRQELVAQLIQLLELDVTPSTLEHLVAGCSDGSLRKAGSRCAARFQDSQRTPVNKRLPYFLVVAEKLDQERRLELARAQAAKEKALLETARLHAKDLRIAAQQELERTCPERALWTWVVLLLRALASAQHYGTRFYEEQIQTLVAKAYDKLGADLFHLDLAALIERVCSTDYVKSRDGSPLLVPVEARTHIQDLLQRAGDLVRKEVPPYHERRRERPELPQVSGQMA